MLLSHRRGGLGPLVLIPYYNIITNFKTSGKFFTAYFYAHISMSVIFFLPALTMFDCGGGGMEVRNVESDGIKGFCAMKCSCIHKKADV